MRRRVVVGVLVAGLLLAACGGNDEPLGPIGSVPQGTTTIDPYAVPAVIDEAYVNRVLAGLDHALGDLVRLLVRERAVSQELIDRLAAIYAGDFLDLTLTAIERDVGNNLDGYREIPGDQITTVKRLISSSDSCIYVEATRDYSPVTTRGVAIVPVWVGLRPAALNPSIAPPYNPTNWTFIVDGVQEDGSEPPNPCVD